MSYGLAVGILVIGAVVLAGLLPFAAHRTLLLRASNGTRKPRFSRWRGPLPRVAVQLPVFNERAVVTRLIDAACRLDYPPHLLEVQVLDDSTDDSVHVAADRIAWWHARGINVRHIRRADRSGFKAGALAAGVEATDADFFLVLDADFVSQSDLVHHLIAPFQDESVGMVQARWDHLNETENALTRAQALLLDGHFFFEQGGRYASERFFNFNGTAGMWRRTCLEEAGGWQSDTLTEDLDLSYRAQMRGWRFEFLGDVGVPAELPAHAPALAIQQKRWAQGGIQTARKVLPELWRGRWPLGVKLEATIHLLGHLAHPLTILLALVLFPATLAREALGLGHWIWLDVALFTSATAPFVLFYLCAARRRTRPWIGSIKSVARTLALGIGLSAPVTLAVLRGLTGRVDPFRRTPKVGGASSEGETGGTRTVAKPVTYRVSAGAADRRLTLFMALWSGSGVVGAALLGLWGSLPFLLLFAAGYGWMAFDGLVVPPHDPPGVERQQAPKREPNGRPDSERLRPFPGRVEGVEAPVG